VSDYADWRITLRLLAPLGTPMQSDTLFGHLCWQIALTEGEAAVGDFLRPFLEGAPPFVLSDAFPVGLLPRPLLPRRPVPADDRRQYAARKEWEKAPFVTIEGFTQLVRGQAHSVTPMPDPWTTVTTPHASINRLLDTTGSRDTEAGQFFQTEGMALPNDSRVQLYLRARPETKDRVTALVRQLALVGFGRDKSVGYGAFAVEDIESWSAFAPFNGADAFVSLSTFMPAPTDPTDGRWRLRIKRGFVGEHGGHGNPFKRPLVQLLPGAVFRTNGQGVRSVYGRMVPHVSAGMAEAVQNGYAFAVPCRWREL
jgi:CRISPR-associated protein Csm4